MSFDIWAVEGRFLMTAPLRTAGYIQLALTTALALAIILPPLIRRKRATATSEAGTLLALVFIAPLAELLLVVRLPETLTVPGLPLEPTAPSFSPLGALVWMAAAGFLGAPQAALVGFTAGIARGGWVTSSVMTPLSMALRAGLAAQIIGLGFQERSAQSLRQPLIAALLASFVLGLTRTGELFAHGSGDFYDALNFSLSLLPLVMLAALLDGGVAGVAGQLMRGTWPHAWRMPAQLRPAPFNRTLTSRMLTILLLLGVLSVLLSGSGQWLLARSALEDLAANSLRQQAQQAGEAVPFFIQTGRATIRRHAAEAADSLTTPEAVLPDLSQIQRQGGFFEGLKLFDAEGNEIGSSPGLLPGAFRGPDFDVAMALALRGVPLEVVVPPAAGAQAVQLVFLAPVTDPGSEEVIGALGGRTSLAEHPLFIPVVELALGAATGEVFLVDDSGSILLHRDPSSVMESYRVEPTGVSEVRRELAPDGTQRLAYVYSVPGYSWKVISQVPLRDIDRTAFPIASRLMLVLGAVGLVFLVFVYWSGQRLTLPLRQMARSAEAIARGDLAHSIDTQGEDEVGRLAASFERMRKGLKQRIQEMDLLLDASQSLASDLDLLQSIPPVLRGVRQLLAADVARLALRDAGERWDLASEALQSGEGEAWKGLDRQIVVLCEERGAFLLDNPARARAVLDVEVLPEAIGALVAAPVVMEGEHIGAMWLARARREPFRAEDQNLLSIVSAQIGVWLANVDLFQRAETERQRLSAVLEVTPDAVVAVDPEGRISLANPAAEVVLTTSHKKSVGMRAEDVIAYDGLKSLLLGDFHEEETRELSLDSGLVWAASVRSVRDGHGSSRGRVALLWDVTHYKKLDMLKSEFVSTVSHDLRAPLTLMRGYATMLSMVGAVNEQQKDFVSKILDGVDGMSQLVENLLDLGRIDAGLGLDLETAHMEEILEEVADSYRPNAVNKQVVLSVEVEPDGPSLQADRTLLRQAIANVVDNGIKFTPAGGEIVVKARHTQDQWHVSVKDTGVGIAPADQARLFERFFRARRPENLKTRGSGLGLAISKSIVEQHGGSIAVKSRLGQGSTFDIRLPLWPVLLQEQGEVTPDSALDK
jgi:signal transduction histidine kinase